MPRIREIKPEFFLDEQLAEVSHAARLLFVGLWTLCDREGRMEDRPARIKAQVFPYGQEDCEALLAELAAHEGRFIERYEVDGRRYLQVRSFTRHQRPHPKETPGKIPAPPTPAVKLHGKPRKETASRESPANQVDPSGGSMGTWAHGSMGDETLAPRGHGSMGGGPTAVQSLAPPESPPGEPTNGNGSWNGTGTRPIRAEDRVTYLKAIWADFAQRFGLERDWSSAEYNLAARWADRGIPLAIVLRGISETGGKPRNLYAAEKAVDRAVEDWSSKAGLIPAGGAA